VGVLVDDDTIVKVAIDHGRDPVPQVHAHAGALAIDRGSKTARKKKKKKKISKLKY